MPDKNTVVLLVPIIAHYRKDVYKNLSGSPDFNFIFFGGNNYESIKRTDELNSFISNYFSFKIGKHKFYYLKGAIRKILKINPRTIISSGVDFHLIHILLLFIIYRVILRRKFYWWSQGTVGHQGRLGWFIRKVVYKLSSGIMLYSSSGYQNLLKMKIRPNKLTILNNCLNNEDYGYLQYNILRRKEQTNEIKILFTGRISEKVDIELLIKSIAYYSNKFKKIICNVIGGGDVNYYSEIAKKYKISSQINFVGPLYGNNAHKYFLESDLFVYPGGIGLSILHALSFGLPVLTTNKMEIHNPEVELLKPGINGDYYIDNDYKSLAETIYKWCNHISKARNKYASNCINTIEEFEYLPKKVGEKVLSFLRKDLLKEI